MTRDREVAQAISEGLNCIAAIAAALRADASVAQLPSPEWAATLDAMRKALEAIAAKEVATSFVADQAAIDRVRKVRTLVSDWTTTQRVPQRLRAEADAVLQSFDLAGSNEMLELTTKFTPADGSKPRIITLRIGHVRADPDGQTWSVAVEVLGFERRDDRVRLRQVDWAFAIRDAARFVSQRVTDEMELAGGGTLDPPIFPPEPLRREPA